MAINGNLLAPFKFDPPILVFLADDEVDFNHRLLVDDVEHPVLLYGLQQRFIVKVIIIFESGNQFVAV